MYIAMENLLAVLHDASPAKADAVASNRRRSNFGLLSVGLKLHVTGDWSQLEPLVDELGGASAVLEKNAYRQQQASICFVLPPVGNPQSAIWLVECIEQYTGLGIFGNKDVQIQVCSPGRLDNEYAGILTLCFYLGSDFMRPLSLEYLQTTFTNLSGRFPAWERGRRITIYDGFSKLDRDFVWWYEGEYGRFIHPQLPFTTERTDTLACLSRLDIRNVNLLSTLLVHAQYSGYWQMLGIQFAAEVRAILTRHQMTGVLSAPWVRTEGQHEDADEQFFSALMEVVGYGVAEAHRLRAQRQKSPRMPFNGILSEVKMLIDKYRRALIEHARSLEKEEPQ